MNQAVQPTESALAIALAPAPAPVRRYLLVFGIADILLGIVFGFVIALAGMENNAGLNVAVLIASSMTAALLFIKKHKRTFLREEYWKMLAGSVAIDLALQLGITFLLAGPQFDAFLLGMMVFMSFVHALLIAFFYSGFITKHLLPKPVAG